MKGQRDMKSIFIFLCCFVFLFSCGPGQKLIAPQGDAAVVTISQKEYNGELLTIYNDTLIFLHSEHIFAVPLTDINKVCVEGYSRQKDKAWSGAMMGMAAILTISMGSGVGIFEEFPTAAYLIYLPPLVLIPYSVFTGDPDMDFLPARDKDFNDRIRLYCRFPQGLNQLQVQSLLAYYGQAEFMQF